MAQSMCGVMWADINSVSGWGVIVDFYVSNNGG